MRAFYFDGVVMATIWRGVGKKGGKNRPVLGKDMLCVRVNVHVSLDVISAHYIPNTAI